MLVVQTTTYLLRAEATMPVSAIRHLADYALLRDREFVIVKPETWHALTDSQKKALIREVGRYVKTIYDSLEEVPESAIRSVPITEQDRRDYERLKKMSGVSSAMLEQKRREIESGRQIRGLKKGMRIGSRLESRGVFWMKSTAHHWVSHRCAESRTAIYIWFLGCWVPVYNIRHSMA